MPKKAAKLSAVERLDVDPKTLLVDINIRTDLRLDKDFVASIKDLGVLVPIIAVRTANGDLRVRHGHRRTVAAIQAGRATVPVDVAGDEGSDDAAQVERILAQHAENAHRAGLTEAENLGVVQQLQAFGMTPAQITKRAHIKREMVDTAIAVGRSDVATAVTGRYDFLTLEQAAAIGEFDDDKKVVKRLVAAAAGKWPDQEDGDRRYARRTPPSFDHVLQQLRDEREEREAKRALTERLEAEGVTIIDHPRYSDATEDLDDLGISVEDHRECPGHIAWLDEQWVEPEQTDDDDDDPDNWNRDDGYEWVAVYGCSDPVANKHRKAKRGESAKKVAEREEAAKEERRRVVANNKAWRAAEEVRRNWLRDLLKGTKAPAGAVAYVFGELADPQSPLKGALDRRHPSGCDLLGVAQPVTRWLRRTQKAEGDTIIDALAKASAGRAEVIALGMALGAHEDILGVNAWRSSSKEDSLYLAKLVEWGYQPSEIEQTVIDRQDDDEADDEDFDDEPRTCCVCGCTDDEACEGGCTWIEDDLCSSCAAS